MPVSDPIHKRLSPGFVYLFLFLVILAFRFYFNYQTLQIDHTANIFRVGVVPWSDAMAWVNGAIEILHGESISGVPTARPIYPIFLSVLFSIFGFSYLKVIYIQMILSALVIASAYRLLKPVHPRIAVWVFICFIVLWRPNVSTIFMTENLGIYILILGFSFAWRGVYLSCEKTVLAGLFFLGLSQAVRPWCVMILVTVPFLGLLSQNPLRKKIKRFLVYVLFIGMGFTIHPLASAIFNKPGEGYANNPQTLYGQVVGGQSWAAVYFDPVIKKALQEKKSAHEVNRIMYQRINTLFWENPLNLVKATVKGFQHYLTSIPKEFGKGFSKPIYFGLFFVILVFLESGINLQAVFHTLRHRKTMIVFLLFGIILFYVRYQWFWIVMVSAGLVPIVSDPKSRMHASILLYLAGVILSIPLVGKDGGVRVMIGNDILLFIIAAGGISWLQKKTRLRFEDSSICTTPPHPASDKPIHHWIVLGSAVLFLIIPYIILLGHRSSHLGSESIADISTDDMVQVLGLDQPPIDPDQLNSIWYQWPNPSFEKLEGQTAYFPMRYTSENAVSLDINQGITGMAPGAGQRHWPLSPFNIRRTVVILERWYTLFPNLSIENLSQFENRRIVVLGRLLTRPRRQLYATPFVLIVSHIVSTNESGKRIVTKL